MSTVLYVIKNGEVDIEIQISRCSITGSRIQVITYSSHEAERLATYFNAYKSSPCIVEFDSTNSVPFDIAFKP